MENPSGHLVPKMTSYRRRCDVITSHRRSYDVIFTSCARWDKFRNGHIIEINQVMMPPNFFFSFFFLMLTQASLCDNL